MKQIIFNLIIIVLIISYIYNLYLNIINYIKPDKHKLNITIPNIPSLQIEKVDNPVLQNPKLWNIEIPENFLNFSQKTTQSKNQCITYNIKKSGKIYTLKTSTGNTLKFFGILKKEGVKYAIFYDNARKEHKLFLIKEGEKIDEFLALKKIRNNNIILENLSNCSQKQTIKLKILSVDMNKYKKLKEETK